MCVEFHIGYVEGVMQTNELDMIIHLGMELNLHKTLCHFQVVQLQDLESTFQGSTKWDNPRELG